MASVKTEDDQISTHHSQKQANQRQEDFQAQMWHAGISAAWQTRSNLCHPTLWQHSMHVEKPVHQKSQQLTLLCFISSSTTRRILHSRQTTCCELDMHGEPESGVSSVLGLAQPQLNKTIVLPLSWPNCQGGVELHCTCKGKTLQIGGCWEEAELWFWQKAHSTLSSLRDPACGWSWYQLQNTPRLVFVPIPDQRHHSHCNR